MWVKKQQLEPYMEHLTRSGLRKAYDRAVCYHPVNLTYMLSTLREMLGWMSFKRESRQVGKTRTWHVDDSWNQKTTASWQESYDKPRQCVEKQRHHSADKGPYSKAMVFSVVTYGCESWTINKGGRAPKNWYLWTVVLEKIPESPLDSMIKQVNLNGN